MRCRICDAEMNLYDKVQNCTVAHAELKKHPFLQKTCEIELYNCSNCSHMQIENKLGQGFYDDYEFMYEGSNMYYGSASSIYSLRLKHLQEIHSGNSIIDIGCGRGDLLMEASKYFIECYGVEPSTSEYSFARKRGLNVIQGYFDNSFKHDRMFDCFISCMVFEHLENPKEALLKANEILTNDGVGLINVPNGKMIVERGLYHQFLTEHINYYTPLSLAKLAYETNFDIISIEEDEKLLEINMYVKKKKNKVNISDRICYQRKQINEYCKNMKRITVWGAGIKSNQYTRVIQDIKVSNLVDKDKSKVGKYISGINIPVQEVEKNIILSSDIIIIFASSYNEEIIEELQEIGYMNNIIYFDNKDNNVINKCLCE